VASTPNVGFPGMSPMTNTVKHSNAVSQVYAHVLAIELIAPVAIELTAPVAGLQHITLGGRQADRDWTRVRLSGGQLGLDVLGLSLEGLSSEAVEALMLNKRLTCREQLLGIDGAEVGRDTAREAARTMGGLAFRRARTEFVARAPRCSVVVCTRERPDGLRQCLSSLTVRDHLNFAVWVIDNAPLSGNTRQVVVFFGAEAENRRGLIAALWLYLRGRLQGWRADRRGCG
jgi:hypothetical protein